jgi:steroid delta-isomerase-like uncharacterized protein
MSTTLETVVAPEERVAAFFAAINRGDLGGALALLSADVLARIEPAGVWGGYDELAAFLSAAMTAFPDLAISLRSLHAFPDHRVVAEVTFAGNQAAPFLGAPNQDRHVDIQQAWMLGVEREQVTAVTAYWDQNQLYRRLGVKSLDEVEVEG